MFRQLLMVGVGLAVLLPGAAWAQRREIHLRVVLDGAWEHNDEIYALFRQEIVDLVGLDYRVVFTPDPYVEGDHTLETVAALVEEALADPGVDLVMTAGPIASNYAAHRAELPKPVVAPFLINPQAQGVPYESGTSGRNNLNYITFTGDFVHIAAVFREVVPFERLTILISEAISQGLPEGTPGLDAIAALAGLETHTVQVGRTVDSALAELGAETQAVVVAPMNQLAPGEFDRLVAALIERRLPSFAVWGRDDVERGLLMTMYRGTDFPRMARRVALNIQRIADGENASTLPVDFPRDTGLIVNMDTARALGVSPSWAIITESELIQAARRSESEGLTMQAAIERTVAENLDLLVESYRVAAQREAIGEARAPLLPQLDLSLVGQTIDVDRARASLGSNPQYLFSAQLSLQQVLYAESAWAGLEITEYVALTQAEAHEQLRLDLVSQTSRAYLDVLRALTVERIAQENLGLTRTNLELARVREHIGVSGPADVYRFEAELATNRQQVIDANASRNLAEIRLNRLMHQPAEQAFQVVEAEMYGADLSTAAPYMQQYLNSPGSFRVFREFMVSEALGNAPELRQLDAAIAARERSWESADRSFWSPTVLLDGDINYTLRAGEGSEGGIELPPEAPFQLDLEQPDDINWTLRLVATLPLFTGLERQARRSRIDQELAELRTRRAAVAERIEQSVRSALHRAGASYAAIQLAQDAAEASQNNLELVQDAYGRGALSIPQLLDAQNAARVSSEVAANAVYDYLVDHVEVQRAVGVFDMYREPSEYEAFIERLVARFAER